MTHYDLPSFTNSGLIVLLLLVLAIVVLPRVGRALDRERGQR